VILTLKIERGGTENETGKRRAHHAVAMALAEIGRCLTECEEIVGHSKWHAWLKSEFAWTRPMVDNYINVFNFDLSKSKKQKFYFLDLLDLPLSSVYLLAAPNTPTLRAMRSSTEPRARK
jgi:hypothetical protein